MADGRIDPAFGKPLRAPLRSLVIVDPRRYRRRRAGLLIAERVYVWGRWTPLVRIRARRARASEGGTEA